MPSDLRLELDDAGGRIPLAEDALQGVQRVVVAADRVRPAALIDTVTALQSAGAAQLTVEAPGDVLGEEGVLDALARAGVSEFLVPCFSLRPRVHDALGGRPGTLPAWLAGVRAAAACARTFLVVPLTRANLKDLRALVDFAAETAPRLTGVLLTLPRPGEASVRGERVPPAAAAAAAARVFAHCKRRGLETGLTDPRGVSPCAAQGALDDFGVVFHERYAFFRGREETLARVPACASCSLSAACRGIEPATVAEAGAGALRPIPLEVSAAWKLTPLNRRGTREFRHVSPFESAHAPEPRSLIRVNGHCNMSCAFCFVDRTVPDFPEAELLAQIAALHAAGGRHLVLSGGEPTLHPALPGLLAAARDLGFHTLEIQTNGVRAADPEYARALTDAGLNKVSVSLHSRHAERSDAITRLPGGFAKTTAAIAQLQQLGVRTQIAHVITRENHRDLPNFVRFVATQLRAKAPTAAPLEICFAVAQGISDLVFPWVMPKFSEIRPHLTEALELCFEHDIGFGGLIGQGGTPPCVLGRDLRYHLPALHQVYKSADHDRQFGKGARCSECSFDAHCLGVRRQYLEIFGDAELSPLSVPVPAAASPLQAGAAPGDLIPARRLRKAALPS